MNESTFDEPRTTASADCCAEVDECVRRNPGTALLIAVGTGLAIGLLVRALRPEPSPRDRVAQMLEDLEDRLRGAADPAIRKAGLFASEGANALQDGLHSSEARLERLVRDTRRKLHRLFS